MASLNLHDLSGSNVQLRDYRGKSVVLNFRATMVRAVPGRDADAGGCRQNVDSARRCVHCPFRSTTRRRKEIPGFVSKYRITFPVWVGARANTLDKLRMGEGVPDTGFIDSAGVIRFRVPGEIRREELAERLAALTGSGHPAELVNHMK